MAQTVKNLAAMPETQVWSLGREDPLSSLCTRRAFSENSDLPNCLFFPRWEWRCAECCQSPRFPRRGHANYAQSKEIGEDSSKTPQSYGPSSLEGMHPQQNPVQVCVFHSVWVVVYLICLLLLHEEDQLYGTVVWPNPEGCRWIVSSSFWTW